MPPEAPIQPVSVQPMKYCNRVLLKDIFEREDEGIGLVGQKVVVGGWVKSFKAMKEEKKVPEPVSVNGHFQGKTSADASCVKLLQATVPLFKSIYLIFGGSQSNDQSIRPKADSPVSPPLKAPPLFPLPRHLAISDGSCVANLQVEIDSSFENFSEVIHLGSCLLVEGVLQQPKEKDKHSIELRVENVLHLGVADPDKYPLAKKRLPLETLRDFPQFRPRTTTVASVMRVRNALVFGAHSFLQKHGFISVQVPVTTIIDMHGFDRQFQVTTLLDSRKEDEAKDNDSAALDALKAAIKEKSGVVEILKRTDSNRETHIAALQDLQKIKKLALQLETKENRKTRVSIDSNELDFFEDFLSKKTYLTTTGRLYLESSACALGSVYTIGPTFHASRESSTKKMAEMWMVEIEMAFTHLKGAIDCAEELLQFLCKWVLDNCLLDLKFLSKRADKTIIERLSSISFNSCERITYMKAVEVFQKEKEAVLGSEFTISNALTAEQFSFLADEIYKKPLIISEFPKEAKPFYTRQNDDGKHVAAFDIFVPQIGRIITGSQNEERLDVLVASFSETGFPREQYDWYLDLRRHGTVPHSGFSLGIDLLVLLATGLTDVRDAVPFFRSHGKADN